MPVKEILQDAKELVVVIETTLNNTLDNPIELGDIIAGPYAEVTLPLTPKHRYPTRTLS